MKRIFDVVLASLSLILLIPVFVVIALTIWAKLGSPVLFRQLRPGLKGKSFEMIKFRSMKNASGPDGNELSDVDRLTRFGKWLRSSSLDELPELWCILRGDMSFVGPRPLLMEYLPLYTGEQIQRLNVRPGLTGWAQVNGRNALSWEEKFGLDIWYVKNISFLLDLKIIWLTAWSVMRREGISADGEATMPKFKGAKLNG
jgi:lipopolysaccharide/colanic/teichoic acid biosynthesis glycosyltransferase